uniref:Eukaryotic translation initiation factor 4B n=1 Tax=Geotrypetes seraphini TaxID=260995 RepID=A0A6P8Q998_GEOSA|nr:eukaryotic translation initiation factor 4B isoform X5 [Geotrypetes seraphini]
MTRSVGSCSLLPFLAKKKNKKGKTVALNDFLAEDSSGGGSGGRGGSYISKPVSWADETDDLEGDVSTTWHSNDDDMFRAPPIDRSILPTAPRAAREPNINISHLPKSPPFTAFLGNLPYDVTEESIEKFFRGLKISAVRLPREPNNPERLKGFGYAEFDDLDSLLSALSLNEESLGNRRIRVDVADQTQDKDRDDRSFGRDRDRNRDSDKTDVSDWRARPTTDSFDDYPPRRGDDSFGDRYRGDRYDSDRYRDGPRRDGDRYERDRYDRGPRDRYDDRDRRDFDRDRRDFDRGPSQRPKLNLKPRSAPKEEDLSSGSSQSSQAASIFGGAKPVDTAAREREVEERLQKEQEKLQRQLEDDKPKLERKPRERHPSWRSEENQERSRTGSESSQTGGTGGSSRSSRRRESEKSVENEVFGKDEEPPSPSSKAPKAESQLPLKVMPAPPPKENAWVKRSTTAPISRSISSESEQLGTGNRGGTGQTEESRSTSRTDENRVDGIKEKSASKSQSGSSGHNWGEGVGIDSERKDSGKYQDSRFVVEPKKLEEMPAPANTFSSASKYAALSLDGEDDEAEEYTE